MSEAAPVFPEPGRLSGTIGAEGLIVRSDETASADVFVTNSLGCCVRGHFTHWVMFCCDVIAFWVQVNGT